MRYAPCATILMATIITLSGCAKEESPAPANAKSDSSVERSPSIVATNPTDAQEAANSAGEAVDDATSAAPAQMAADTITEKAEDTTAQAASDIANATESAAPPSKRVEAWADLFNNIFEDGDFYSAGIPTEEGLRKAADKGVKLVVSLLPDDQQANMVKFDEPALLKELGVRFERIPVTGSSFSKADVDAFAKLMESTDGPVLTHCASANRVGAMWAAYLTLHKGEGMTTAIEEGESMGLRSDSLIAKVRNMAAE